MAELIIDDKMLYMISDREFYEPLDRYSSNTRDFQDPLRRIMPPGWSMNSRGFWCDCMRSDAEMPAQGWKIHLSATPAHATGILLTAARILFAANVPFKFVVDRVLLLVSNGKRWHRGSAGKFMTVYPRDTEQCGELLEALHQATIGYWGPYILSDRRYANSRIVHYRYGGLLPLKRLGVNGRSVYVIQDADGGFINDERNAFFHLPPGIEDPFERFSTKTTDDAEPGTLKYGRYRIESMLSISNSGGVYLAFDTAESRKVVIKEARPYTNVSVRGLDAIQLLKKEHRLLGVLSGTGVAPEPYDFFFDWEHAYLVEEYLDGGVTLRESITQMSLLLRTRPTREDSKTFYRRYRKLFSRLAEIVGVLHASHIVFSDLSMAQCDRLRRRRRNDRYEIDRFRRRIRAGRRSADALVHTGLHVRRGNRKGHGRQAG
jgi:hypothetical protein